MADRYLHDRRLPATAIDLIDEAGAQAAIDKPSVPLDLRALDDRIQQTRAEKEAMIDAQNWERAAQLRDREKQLLREKAQQEAEWRSQDLAVKPVVDADNIRQVVERMLEDRRDGESAAPTTTELPGAQVSENPFDNSDHDVWTMS
jgi:ATP-dependent Clp protease ATP-binding subunit ClpC